MEGFEIMKVLVVDAGAFGTAMAALLAPKHEVTLMIQDFNQAQKDLYFNLKNGVQKSNYLYLREVELPRMEFTDNFDAIKNADVVFLAVPSQYIYDVYLKIHDNLLENKKCALVLLTKGMDYCGNVPWGLKLRNNLKLSLGSSNFAVLSGYTPAEGIALSQSTWKHYAASVASENLNVIKKLRKLFLGTNLGIIGTTDIAGVSLGGALKNAYAIGYGILTGLAGLAQNEEEKKYYSVLSWKYLELAHREMKVFLNNADASSKTWGSPAMKGDFYLTSVGEITWESRNVSFGKFLANYKPRHDKTNPNDPTEKYLRENTVEGYESLMGFYEIAQREKLNAPLLYSLHSICEFAQSPDVLRQIVEILLKHKPVN